MALRAAGKSESRQRDGSRGNGDRWSIRGAFSSEQPAALAARGAETFLSGNGMSGSDFSDQSGSVPAESAASSTSPLQQPWFPQLSIRFFLGLMVLSAAVLWVFRAALIADLFWAKCVSMVLIALAGCFVAYAAFFLLALAVATLSFPLVKETLPANEASAPGPVADPPEAPTP